MPASLCVVQAWDEVFSRAAPVFLSGSKQQLQSDAELNEGQLVGTFVAVQQCNQVLRHEKWRETRDATCHVLSLR